MTWRMVTLGEIAQLNCRGEAPEPDLTYRLAGVRWWGEGAYQYKIVSGAETQAKQLNRIEPYDLIINKIWARHGSIAVAGEDMAGAYGSSEFPTFVMDGKKVEPRFVHWFSKTKLAWSQCELLSRGTSGKNRVKPERFLSIRLPLPPLADQRQIVARLDAAAVAIERVEELRSEIDKDLAAFIIRSNETYEAQPTRLANALTLDEDRVAVSADAIYPQVGIRGFGGGLFRKGGVTAADTTYRHFNRLAAGQFVVSQVKGWEGAVAVCCDEFAGLFASPEYRTFRCNPATLNPAYFAHLSRTPWFHAKLAPATRGQGARRERLRPEMLLAITIPLPPVDVQDRLVPLFDRVAAAAANSGGADLDHLLPAMLNETFGTSAGA
ncbi:restriction endonuclease subunit S [Sphingomonas sp. Leaf62]|uniref:restriction endonuclease subunit S n=1 Tax=Sphingomonas sp. Leaf62 TaxID=1736228 RepID=UPI000701D6D4|nr:restriction endonuclease subunit S [Sphingomonas sp. Leaf62]KQN80545.1 hypothetical protein ASE91_11165 [Sphingomonas sp. Leaf62]